MFELVKKLFFHNYLLFLPVTAFISAQILKIIIYRIQHGKPGGLQARCQRIGRGQGRGQQLGRHGVGIQQ